MLDPRQRYLQIAFNQSLAELKSGILSLPKNKNIIVEIGTPLIKSVGVEAIHTARNFWSGYILADLKCMDRGATETNLFASAGANGITCLGLAPIATVDAFVVECANLKIDSFVDMLGVKFPFEILQKLKKKSTGVVLHRGVDEAVNRAKIVPYIEINRIYGAYSCLIASAGGETGREVARAHFNGSHIAVVWREFNPITKVGQEIIKEFLRKA
ncbi:MAG: hypothetical protein A3J93_04995 [Candidatus Magasanikbacteria bacterium RIFOXYC2_FULL_42_28]|uniref:Orotidine 5'-phosphate decarboxylase domain-containing protein n=1 Tax=Candidatus Magasanikbacteria bacterium RIFOXYC2_FULL_42_28 TaxID=1798704 RepID=A0A1F6NVM3_9BACT|nr:MAG: hypothetical protein A3J93_04995 [Candidatus Magasanikbacteria bacterium RIFOXYC2_FULL_42_28]